MKYFSIAGVSIVLAVLAAGCIGPGTTFVGPDTHNGQTPPGLWRTVGGDGCYWARLDATGAIIENEFSPGGPRYAMIEPTDGLFETQGCITWWQQSPNNALGIGLVGVPGQPFDQGDFLVKAEITPGQYVAAGSPSGCYWARTSGPHGFGSATSQVIDNNFGSGQVVVTIQPTDYGFTSTGCGTWFRTGR